MSLSSQLEPCQYAAHQQSCNLNEGSHPLALLDAGQYVLVGSSNINQRSMDGARDTEISTGAFQPAYTHRTADPNAPTVKGQVGSIAVDHLHPTQI